MASRRPNPSPKMIRPESRVFIFPFGKTAKQACFLFLFSFLFAILFNLFYSDGIELKVKPPKALRVDFHKAASVASSYAGWGAGPTPSVSEDPEEDRIPRVSLIGAKIRFDHKSSIFLDARKFDEYKEGHIPGAIDFFADEFDKFAPQVLPQLPDKNQEIIAYCHGSGCELSILLAKKLVEQGYTNVKVFFGGWPQWKKAAYPIDTGVNP